MSTSTRTAIPGTSPLPDIVGLGGAIAGLIGGLAMALVGAIISAWLGGDIWLEVEADRRYRLRHSRDGPARVRRRASAGWNAAAPDRFRSARRTFQHRHTPLAAADLGVRDATADRHDLSGMLIWLVAYFLVLPILNPVLMLTYAPVFIVQHLVYGESVTGLAYTWLRPQPYEVSR